METATTNGSVATSNRLAIRKHFAGETLDFPSAEGGIKVHVFSIGLIHYEQFGEAFDRVIRKVLIRSSGRQVRKGATIQEIMGQLGPIALPVILHELSAFIDDCVIIEGEGLENPSIMDFPDEIGLQIVEAWVNLSFTDKKKEMLKSMFERQVQRFPKEKQQAISKLLSSASAFGEALLDENSSISDNTDGPTPVGASSNSGDDSTSQSTSEESS